MLNLLLEASFVSSKFKKPLIQKMFGVFMSKLVTTYDQINGVRVEVERAPEPTDIQWLNLRYGEKERHVHRFITNSVTLILVILSFGGILLVNWGQVIYELVYGITHGTRTKL